jgi:hypothetical protein
MSCPAATLLEGPPDRGPSALCGVIVNDRQREGLVSGPRDQGVLVTARSDPSSYLGFCAGAYVKCPVWIAEKQRLQRESRVLSADVA